VEQLRELLTNYGRIDLIWFDVPGFGADRWRSSEVKQMMLNLQPHLIINDRLPGVGDFDTPEQFVPLHPPEEWWETCITMNQNWVYHPDVNKYKSVVTLLNTLLETALLTAKHHDGFCLFDTKTTDYNAAQRGPKRDLIAPYVEALHTALPHICLFIVQFFLCYS
jgi:hypothetical protein